ncbi:MAG: response regulator [Lentisphaerae bacterium]|nr:response regulator [Lentisphaerota bacterium]
MADDEDKMCLLGLRVLLVEDDAESREFLTVGLELEGITVVSAVNADEAIEALQHSFFDVITTDMKLPGMDGLGLLRYVRENVGEIPVILITGYGSVGSAVDALKLGAQDYLSKPFKSIDVLLSSIWRAVNTYRLTIQNKALHERLLRAEKLEFLANLAGGVAHDLNNILSPMICLSDILIEEINELGRKNGLDVEEMITDLTVMKSSGKRAASVVRDLMASSRTGNLERVSLNMNELVSAWLSSQEVKEIESSLEGLEVNFDKGVGPMYVEASEPHIMRALSNLAHNALEAMDPAITEVATSQRVLTISTLRMEISEPLIGYDIIEKGCYIRVSVTDTGIGINEADIPRIFEPFFTCKKNVKKSGSGLGLAVVNSVMRDHDGFIDVYSVPGHGTVFHLYFPCSSQVALPRGDQPLQSSGNERILVVDDELCQRRVASRMLSALGYKVSLVNDGQEAVKLIKKSCKNGRSEYDLIVLDMIMDENFDGLDTLYAIREICPEQKVIIVSGFAPTGRVQTAINMGAGWLQKPYEIGRMSVELRTQLDSLQVV